MPQTQNHTTAGVLIVKVGHTIQKDCWKKGDSTGTKTKKQRRWCSHCKSPTHEPLFCRHKAKQALHNQASLNEENKSSDANHFNFKITEICENKENSVNAILVDSGATCHIICDEKKFIRFSEKFNHTKKHTLELADGSRSGDLIKTIGEAQVEIIDTNGVPRKAVLHNALYVPSFNQDIFSVRAETENGATISFSKDSGNLHSNGTNFGISKRNNLYYLDSVSSVSVSSSSNVRPLKEWHEVMVKSNLTSTRCWLGNAIGEMVIQR